MRRPPRKQTPRAGRREPPEDNEQRRQQKVGGGNGDGDGAALRLREEDETTVFAEAAAREPQFPIVGVGASAGGLEAFSQLLSALPADAGMAVILVQHLSPRHESVLPELLAHATSMPVMQVAEGMEIKSGNIYVTAPNSQISIANNRFNLTPRPLDHTQHNPIDFFFRSLAGFAQNRAIGVILSGTATDGSVGLKEIKAVGGITLAQDPKTAKYDGMPRSAIATGSVDVILPPQEIAAELTRISKHPLVRAVQVRKKGDDLEVMDEQLRRIFTMLRNATTVDFTHYKPPTIRRRLQRRLVLHKISNMEQYIKFLQQSPEEVQALYADLLIHVTRFFREREAFASLAEVVYPALINSGERGASQDGPIRVWVPGCATGEEAYSIAMSLLEFMGVNVAPTPVQIFATDVSETAVEFARSGIYPESIIEDVSPERLRRFFTRQDGGYRISKQVRDLCVFARQDLTRDPPFSKLDMIVCRNVLIYLNSTLQKKLMGMFHYALKPSAYLLLGAAETIGASADLFAVADKRHRLYVKKNAYLRTDMNFDRAESALSARSERAPKLAPATSRSSNTVQGEANRIVLERYSPPGVILDADLQIIQFRGHTGPFLEPAPGDASLSVLKMAREGLLYGLRTAINEVRRTGKTARRGGLRVKHDGHMYEVELEVIPLEGPDRHFLVLLKDVTNRPSSKLKRLGKPKGRKGSKERQQDDQVVRLQQELAASRDYLQSIIQDLEAANEELQSANEEILSANEELQSTNEELDTAKEELQSTNEELNTVNEELHGRNEELSRANSDLVNLLGSVNIAIVMVSRDLRIRRFTPTAERVLNLIPSDVGRPITDIKPNIDCPDLEKLIHEAVDGITTVERAVHDRHGRRYSLRIRPYKNLEERIDGAVLALFDDGGAAGDGGGRRGDGDGKGDGSGG